MKVIFLDVDGVLNSEKDLLEAKGKSELFDRPLILLKELVESTKAKIVVSSTWRIGCSKSGRNSWYGEGIFKTLTDRLAEYQMEVYDITPVINKPGVQRGDEIRAWLENAKEEIDAFVILDDDADMCEFTGTNLVQTSMKTGLLEYHVEIAKSILNGENITHDVVIDAVRKVWDKLPELRFGQQRSPTLGFGLDTPVHYATRVFLPGSQKIINLPICGANCVCPLLLTDDIEKCTCHDCIIKVMQRMIGIKQKGENEDEEKSDTDGIRS